MTKHFKGYAHTGRLLSPKLQAACRQGLLKVEKLSSHQTFTEKPFYIGGHLIQNSIIAICICATDTWLMVLDLHMLHLTNIP